MKFVCKISASAVMAVMLLTGCSSLDAASNATQDNIVKVAPTLQAGFRFSAAENFDIANKDKLSYRNFYEKPSTGADARWFDAVKRGDLATVQYMVAASNNRIETVKYLLSKGANPNLVATTKDKKLGSYNQGAYSYACTRGHIEMQQLLKANGAINHRTGKASCE